MGSRAGGGWRSKVCLRKLSCRSLCLKLKEEGRAAGNDVAGTSGEGCQPSRHAGLHGTPAVALEPARVPRARGWAGAPVPRPGAGSHPCVQGTVRVLWV